MSVSIGYTQASGKLVSNVAGSGWISISATDEHGYHGSEAPKRLV
jgi:hypothetical protein